MSLSRAGLEVYVTEKVEETEEEEGGSDAFSAFKAEAQAHIDGGTTSTKTTTSTSTSTSTDTETDTDTEEETEANTITKDASTDFTLENGPTIHIDFVGELFSDSFEMDYTDISSNSSVSVPIDYVDLFFKGKKMALKKAWQNDTSFDWEKDMETAVLGFCTELTWNRDKVDVKISGMDKLMEAEAQFDFQQMKRSEIVKAIIETAGLKAEVDPTGLVDDVIDFTNIQSTDDTGTGDSTGSATIDEAVEKAIKGKKGCLEKAKAIDQAFKSHVIYDLYYNAEYSDLDAAWKDGTLNCADGANILCAMFRKAGIQATIIHVPPEYSKGYGHYVVKVICNGKEYYTDNAATSGNHTTRPFGEVFGQPIGSDVGTKV